MNSTSPKNRPATYSRGRVVRLLAVTFLVGVGTPALAQEPPPNFPDPFSIRVHLRSPNPTVTLFHTTGQVSGYFNNFGGRGRGQLASSNEVRKPVCATPCGEPVERVGLYVVGGPGLAFSRRFRMPPEAGEVWLDVKPGSKGVHAAAIAPIVVGSVNLVLGFVFLAQSARLNDQLLRPSPIQVPVNPADVTRFRNLGIGFAVGGGAVLIGGILWRVFTGTRVTLKHQDKGNWVSKHLGPGVIVF